MRPEALASALEADAGGLLLAAVVVNVGTNRTTAWRIDALIDALSRPDASQLRGCLAQRAKGVVSGSP